MTKFNITLVTKQAWSAQVEARDIDEARQIRDKFADEIQDEIAKLENVARINGPMFQCDELFGGDDFTDDDIDNMDVLELPEAERASKCAVYSLTIICPHCSSEMIYSDEEEDYNQICSDIDNDGVAIVTCPNCGERFRQVSYKEY